MKENYDVEKKMFERIKRQGVDYKYTSENPIAKKCIEWTDEWVNQEIERMDEFINHGRISGLESKDDVEFAIWLHRMEIIKKDREKILYNMKLHRCMFLEGYIQKVESTLNESDDFKFFNENEDLYKAMVMCLVACDYERSIYYSGILADNRKAFNEKNGARNDK